MGGEQSKKDQMIKIVESYNYQKDGVVSQKEFVDNVFQRLDNLEGHTDAGPLIISGTYVLKALYQLLVFKNKGPPTKSRVIEVINKIYDKPQKSIEYSYCIIQNNPDQHINRKQFIDFIMNCYDRGVISVMRHNKSDSLFNKSFQEWTTTNRIAFIQQADRLFTNNAKSQRQVWVMGDFKRWIMDQNHWMIYVSIKNEIFRIPLNIPCLFGVKIQPKK